MLMYTDIRQSTYLVRMPVRISNHSLYPEEKLVVVGEVNDGFTHCL